jgi:hypothetical protein
VTQGLYVHVARMALYLALHSCIVSALADVPHKHSAVTITRLRIIIMARSPAAGKPSAAGATIEAYRGKVLDRLSKADFAALPADIRKNSKRTSHSSIHH